MVSHNASSSRTLSGRCMSWLTLRCRGPREQGWLGWLRLGARSAERLRPLVLRRAPARRVLASAPPCRERHCSDQTEHPVTHSLSARQPPTHSSARAAPWTRAQARPCRPGEGATERVSSATARTPRCQGSPGERCAHTVPFRRAAKPLTVRRRMHASLLTHPWPFPLLQDARMQNKQGPIFAWERQTRCVASMRGTGIRLGPSTTHPFLPRSPHALQKGHALAPHTGYLEVHGVTFQGHVARHIRYIGHRVKLETNGGGASVSGTF